MSSFHCEYCGKAIIDSGPRYTTACEHYPNKLRTHVQQLAHQEWLKGLKTLDEQGRKP